MCLFLGLLACAAFEFGRGLCLFARLAFGFDPRLDHFACAAFALGQGECLHACPLGGRLAFAALGFDPRFGLLSRVAARLAGVIPATGTGAPTP